MAQQVITISLNASDFASKVNANFSELFTEFGSGLTRQIVSKDESAGTFISKCNTNFSNLFTAASPSQSRTTLTDSMSANQVVNALNTNFDILYGTESGGGGEVVPTEKLKVLFFGNSYTANSVFYLPFILKTLLDGINSDLEFKIAFFFAAGTAIDYYYNNYNANVSPQLYTFDSESSTAWQTNNVKIKTAVEGDDWDLVVLQQFSQDSFVASSYANVGNLINLVKASAGNNCKIGWNITHPNGQVAYNHPLDMLSIMQSVCQQNDIDVVLPYGTAICNALTKSVCRSYTQVASVNRSFRLSDNTHLSPGLPMYIASLAIAQALSDEFSLGFSVQDDMTTPTVGWSTQGSEEYKGIWPVYTNTQFLSVTDSFRAIAKRAVAAAMTDKFSVTQLDGETLTVTYNLTGCHIEGTAPTTGINFGETISFRIVADEGKMMSTVKWQNAWANPSGSDQPYSYGQLVSYSLGENGEFEKVVTEDLKITATAT